ncbi:MAG: phosphatase PAP2 family protein [Leptolyngbyaceae cyanobacterium bins.302]|nr:phosphatase PAP2 family protein [Leptolyngbyaceae cyanobacterium bins.302]
MSYVFPSGHAMASASFVMVLIVLAWNTRWRWLVLVGGSLFVLAIGWTRIYLGMHYPSDVVAGWLLEIAWSFAVLLVIRLFNLTPNPHNSIHPLD